MLGILGLRDALGSQKESDIVIVDEKLMKKLQMATLEIQEGTLMAQELDWKVGSFRIFHSSFHGRFKMEVEKF